MSHYPPRGPPGPPPPYFGPPGYPPHLQPPHLQPPHHYPPPPPQEGHPPHHYPYFYPMPAMMMPMAVAPMPMPTPGPSDQNSNPTYITNYIYHGEGASQPAIEDKPQVVELSGEFDWVPTTATTAVHLTGKAVVGGHEGWDGSPLWVIRAWHNGDLIPGKYSVRHTSASIMYDRKEIAVQNIEVLCAKPETLKWVPASNGNVPPGAVPGGRTITNETLYVGRARYQLSVTPGKVHPSHNCCYISFAGNEVAHKMYDVLCRV